MKTNKLHYIFLFVFLMLLLACSTKKNKLINREFQALNTKFNVLYHGNIALEKGIFDLKAQYKDNFWEILSVERMQVAQENILPGQKPKNPNFERAEDKATKAIQKRSMNIGGKEKNPQMDEAHLLLGKSRYYDQRFIPALDAFNYILYKYPESDKIYEAKIWREKTNMRLDNDAIAVKNLRRLLKEIKFKDQIFADANATLSQAFLNLNEKDSAIARIKLASSFTKSDEEKARYQFILGQLYDELGYKDSAFAAFGSVIAMHRKSPRRYTIQAHAKQAEQFDFKNGDTLAFVKNFNELLKDRENRPFLDVINYQMGLFYDKKDSDIATKKFYNKSLRSKSEDQYLMASNYKNLAKRYFDNAKYQTAGNYYDSTLVRLTPRTREYNAIKKKRENLADVIKYEAIAQQNDSILNVVSLSDADKKGFYEAYIIKLKKEDAIKAAIEKKRLEKEARESNESSSNDIASDDKSDVMNAKAKGFDASSKNTSLAPPTIGPKPTNTQGNAFYFYNQTTVAFGKIEFRKKWGKRPLKNNWRLSADQTKENSADDNEVDDTKETVAIAEEKIEDPRYFPEFYIKQLPTTTKEIDSLAKDRNFAYYQLGIIYKEKFKEYFLASTKLEQLLTERPEERLVLPALYNLYKIYQIIDNEKATATKNKIINQYPNSRYAQIVSNANDNEAANQSPEVVYSKLYKDYENGKLFQVLEQSTAAIENFEGDEIIPKLELLKANTIGKLKGLSDYKMALNFVALNYPNSDEGKEAEQIVTKNIPILEKLKFYDAKPESWKILYKYTTADSLKTKVLINKLKKFSTERTSDRLQLSDDIYTMTESFVVLHGISSENKAADIAVVLKEFKDYKIQEKAIVVSNENYAIIQFKKNLSEYLTTPKTDPVLEPKNDPSTQIPTSQNQKDNDKQKPSIPNSNPNSSPMQPPGGNLSPQDLDDPEPTNEKTIPADSKITKPQNATKKP